MASISIILLIWLGVEFFVISTIETLSSAGISLFSNSSVSTFSSTDSDTSSTVAESDSVSGNRDSLTNCSSSSVSPEEAVLTSKPNLDGYTQITSPSQGYSYYNGANYTFDNDISG